MKTARVSRFDAPAPVANEVPRTDEERLDDDAVEKAKREMQERHENAWKTKK